MFRYLKCLCLSHNSVDILACIITMLYQISVLMQSVLHAKENEM